MKYSKDGIVSFDHEKHIYRKGGKILKGVTGLIGSYKNYFDKELESTKYAEKHGLVKEGCFGRLGIERQAITGAGNGGSSGF